MTLVFNAGEAVEIAVEIERNGQRFYRQASERAGDAELRRALAELADMEKDHEDAFLDVKGRLTTDQSPEIAYDPNNEVVQYLGAIADVVVFNVRTDWSDVIEGTESVEELLKLALQLERDSVAYYVGLAQLVPAKLGRSVIERLIREEMDHVVLIAQHLSSVQAGS
jgi:rubrerythrin